MLTFAPHPGEVHIDKGGVDGDSPLPLEVDEDLQSFESLLDVIHLKRGHVAQRLERDEPVFRLGSRNNRPERVQQDPVPV